MVLAAGGGDQHRSDGRAASAAEETMNKHADDLQVSIAIAGDRG